MTKVMYHGTSLENYIKMKESGVIADIRSGSHERSAWLTTDIEIAKRFADRTLSKNETPTVLFVDTESMANDGVTFYDTMSCDVDYETDDIPSKYIMGAVVMKGCTHKERDNIEKITY